MPLRSYSTEASYARACFCFSFLATTILLSSQAGALPRTWIGGNADWVDAGAATNWNPNDEPDSDDEAIFNTANSVNLGSNNSTNGLTLSGGIDLFTNEFDLEVDGLVQAAGSSTSLIINGAGGSINADDVVINADGTIELRGGRIDMDEEAGTSLIDINVDGNLIGNGTIQFDDLPGVPTLMFVNDGEITALSRGVTIFSPPPVGTLTITDSNANGRIDLDGSGEAGVVNVNRNQTLASDMFLQDAFNGDMNLFHNSTFDFNPTFTLSAGGTIDVDNGFVAGGLGFSDILADTSYIETEELVQTGGTITVVDTDGTLQIDGDFTMSGGTFTNNGTVIFNGTTNITTAAGYSAAIAAHTIINAPMTVFEAGGNFNWDGAGAASTTINGTASLTLSVNQIDTGDNIFGGTLTLNDSSDVSVSIPGTSWTMGGTLNKNGAGISTITGDGVIVAGTVNANNGTLDMPTTTTQGSSVIVVNGTMWMGAASVFGGGSITGTGELEMEGTSSVSANTTIGVATFDWDGIGTGTNHTINAGVIFTINSANLDNDGDMDDPINLAGSGSQLIVNGPTQWTATAAINANNAAVGTATIGGTSRLILSGADADLNVNGNTNITAPLTFGFGSSASIDAGFTLDAANTVTYDGASILGAGTYSPGTTNTVTAQDAQITAATFDFDGGGWVIEPGGLLDINVTDYDTTVTNAFDNTITINGGEVDVTTGDAFFVMNGTLNMQTSPGNPATWDGEAIHIGDDSGALNANLNVTGTGSAEFGTNAGLTFNSDADVNIAAGSRLAFLSGMPVTFNTVNAANNAEFTGSGEIEFTGNVNVNEAVTFNMTGGTIDFDSADTNGATVNVDAPFVINAATVESYGNVNTIGGPDTIDVNNSVGTGVLTVNLDNANAEWTLNGPGVMNLVNDNTDATLLAGSDVNVNGTLNVTGDVRTAARLDIGSTAVVNINTAAQPLRLAGGNDTNDVNTIAGAVVNGVGVLGADTGKALHGFGTINTQIDFDGTADLRADNGTLTIDGTKLLDVETLGTADDDGVLHVTGAWNNNVTGGIQLLGGTLSGGTITNDTTAGISGHGLVTSRVINNTQLHASLGDLLVFETAGNDNDWDGTTNTGEIEATGADIEIRDEGAAFGFTGTVRATNGNTAFANGFALDFNPGSALVLSGGSTYRSTNSTDIGGTVTVNVAESTIDVENNNFLTFEAGSSTTLNANLRLLNNNIIVEDNATFSGTGAVIVPDGSHMVAENGADMGVLLDMQGALRPGNSQGIARVDMLDFQTSPTSELYFEFVGTSLNAYDRLVVDGTAVVDGFLSLDIDDISPGVPFVPVLGNTFNIITATSVVGAFDTVDVSGMPAGLAFHVEYLANAVQLQVVNKPIFSADFDDDGDVDSTDLSIWKNAYNLNQLGDADGDNDSDGSDFMLWQQQFGSAPAVAVAQPAAAAVPEPSAAVLLLTSLAAAGWRRSRDRLRA